MTTKQEITIWERLTRDLKIISGPESAKLVMDKAEALEVLAKRVLNREMECFAATARVRAQRELGRYLSEMTKHPGGRPKKTGSDREPVLAADTLSRLKIDKKLSVLTQRLYAVSEQLFESHIYECLQVGDPPRAVEILRRRPGDMAVHYGSDRTDYLTPPEIIQRVQAVFGGEIDLDPCGNRGLPMDNVPAAKYYTETEDGLAQPWSGKVFCNPPYGGAVSSWVDKAITESQEGHADPIILLLAARTDTRWFYKLRDFACCFIRQRLRFVGSVNTAPFPSVLFWISEQSPAVFASTFEDMGTTYLRWRETVRVMGSERDADDFI